MKIILSVAGSDPSGGAGIQADLKTIASLGCYGAAAITAITCQNTLGVSHCQPLPAHLVADQITAVLEDLKPSHIKIGMTASAEIIATLTALFEDFSGEIILDPVLKSSSGQVLLANDPATTLIPLLHRVSVLTPNIQELAVLSQRPVHSETEATEAGRSLMDQYSNIKALCIKGGHLQEESMEVIDILLTQTDGVQAPTTTMVRHPRRRTMNSHGTGCTFASAFAAYHAHGASYQAAFSSAVHYVDTLLELSRSTKIGRGRGPLLHHQWQQQAKDQHLDSK